jgi:ATP-dependent 26S proteasome regulatory subunit
MSKQDAKRVMEKLQASTPLMYIETHEPKRTLVSICSEITRSNKDDGLMDEDGQAIKFTAFQWSRANGIRQISVKGGKLTIGEMIPNEVQLVDPDTGEVATDDNGKPRTQKVPSTDPKDPLMFVEKAPRGTVMFLRDYHKYFDHEHYQEQDVVLSKINDDTEVFQSNFKSLIVMSSVVQIPEEIDTSTHKTSFSLPNREELKAILKSLCSPDGIKYPDNDDEVIDAALGLTDEEFTSSIAESAVKTGGLVDAAIIRDQKAERVRKAGLLDVIQQVESVESIGGLGEIKAWLNSYETCFSPEAKAFGCKTPKGLLLVGVPGTGKSLTAKAIASMWHRPLLRFDIGKVFDKYVGESESKIRRCLAIAEAVAPCVLWIDEVEKGMAGSGGGSDSGGHEVTKRVFGTLLTWLSDKEADVFVVATANNVRSIPDELYRPGRIDASFWLDLPGSAERRDILKIQIRKSTKDGQHREAETLLKPAEIDRLVKESRGLSGAGIEVWVQAAVKRAWTDKGGRRDICLQDFLDTIGDISKTNMQSKNIQDALKWAKENKVKSASGNPLGVPREDDAEPSQGSTGTTLGGRKVVLNLSKGISVKPISKDGQDESQAQA